MWDVAFGPDGSQLVSTGPDGVARIWALDLHDLTAAERRQYLRERACR